ncbi:MAG: class I SAM-dependent methyltransferase [Lachnospiraceae bacterium]|nr:class I SAM-dependent methyltransferase [Lachnospiraceae bacterium]
MEQVCCTLCKSKNISYIPNKIRNDTEGIYKMYRCEDCETHFLYPKPVEEQLKDYYDGKFREEVHSESYYDYETLQRVFARFSPEAQQRVRRVEKELQPVDEVLEIGCSVGYFLSAIADKVNAVYGTEWDKKAQKYIRDCLGKDNVFVGNDPEDFGKQFDKIFMFHVLEHIGEPVDFLQNVKGLLKSGGILYIEVPNVDDVLVKTYQCDAFKNFYYKKAHLYNFNEKGLAYVFQQAGFNYEIDYIERYDLSNHLYWLGNEKPGGKGFYAGVLGEEVNRVYVEELKKQKQTDTLFAKAWL